MRIPSYPCYKCKGTRFSYEHDGGDMILFTCTNCKSEKIIIQRAVDRLPKVTK